jgi:hypothetical protein
MSAIDSLPSRAALAEPADVLLDLGDRHLVGIAHHRHDEALVGADGDADMGVVLVDDVVPSISALTAGISFSACVTALVKKPMKPSFTPCFFSNRSLYFAQVHHRLHVHLVEGGEHGGRVLRVLQAARDGLAQAGHLHPLFAASVALGRPEAHARNGAAALGRGCDGAPSGDGVEHIALQHLAALAGALNLIGRQAGCRPEFGGGRGRRQAVAARSSTGEGQPLRPSSSRPL